MAFKPPFSSLDGVGETPRHGDVDGAPAIELQRSPQGPKPRGSEDASRLLHPLLFAYSRRERTGLPEPPQLVRGDGIQWRAELEPKGGLVQVSQVLRPPFRVGLLHGERSWIDQAGVRAELRMAPQEYPEVER